MRRSRCGWKRRSHYVIRRRVQPLPYTYTIGPPKERDVLRYGLASRTHQEDCNIRRINQRFLHFYLIERVFKIMYKV